MSSVTDHPGNDLTRSAVDVGGNDARLVSGSGIGARFHVCVARGAVA